MPIVFVTILIDFAGFSVLIPVLPQWSGSTCYKSGMLVRSSPSAEAERAGRPLCGEAGCARVGRS